MLWIGWCVLLQTEVPANPAVEPPNACSASALGLDADKQRFRGLLADLRGGEQDSAGPLIEVGRHLAREHGRSDCEAIAAYYAGLTPAERRAGMLDEAEVDGLIESIKKISTGDPYASRGSEWIGEYQAMAARLVALAERARANGDVEPAAKALGFAAHLEMDLAENRREARELALGRASEHLEQALALYERTGHWTLRLEPLWTRGRVARARGELAESERAFTSCADLARRVEQPQYEVRGLLGLVTLARDRGDVSEVGRLLARTSSVQPPGEYWPLAREQAISLLHSDHARKALEFLRQHEPEHEQWFAEWNALICASHLRLGQLEEARQALEEVGLDTGNELYILARASLDMASGNPQGVIASLRQPLEGHALSELGYTQGASLFGEAWLALGKYDTAISWLEAALDRAGSWSGVQDGEREVNVLGEWIGLHTVVLLAEAHVLAGRELAAAVAIESSQSQGLRSAIHSLSSAHKAYVPASELAADEAEIRAWAARHELGLLTWCIGANRSVTVHVDREGRAHARLLELGRRQIEEGVRRLCEAARDGLPERAAELGRALAAGILPKSFLDACQESGPQATALFLLHGPLERLPLPLLELAGEPLLSRCSPTVLPGLPQAAAQDAPLDGRSLAGARWYLCGAPSEAAEQSGLPGASEELERLEELHPGSPVLAGPAFTASALEEALGSGAPLHIATHLVPYDDCDPLQLSPVALVLSGNERLCASSLREIAPHSPLVVLSTCESADGRFVDAEGLKGLTRAFLESGTRTLLVTLWPVEDHAASRAALLFHEGLRNGLSPALAAQAASTGLAAEGFPIADWSAYRLVGGY